MFVSIGAADDTPSEVTVNHSLVAGYLAAMKEISDTYHIENDATVVSVSRFPDVFTVNKKYRDVSDIQFNGTIVQCVNELPTFSDTSESMYRSTWTEIYRLSLLYTQPSQPEGSPGFRKRSA